MDVVWEPPNDGLARGFSDEGHELAQVAHIHSPAGDEIGWVAWLTHGGELHDRYATLEAARRAVEDALNRGRPGPTRPPRSRPYRGTDKPLRPPAR